MEEREEKREDSIIRKSFSLFYFSSMREKEGGEPQGKREKKERGGARTVSLPISGGKKKRRVKREPKREKEGGFTETHLSTIQEKTKRAEKGGREGKDVPLCYHLLFIAERKEKTKRPYWRKKRKNGGKKQERQIGSIVPSLAAAMREGKGQEVMR